jgi:hypothetical protein
VERDAAKLVVIEAYRAMLLSDLLPFLKQVCTPGEYEELRLGIAGAVDGIRRGLLDPIYRLHPDLEAEIAKRIERTGKAY